MTAVLAATRPIRPSWQRRAAFSVTSPPPLCPHPQNLKGCRGCRARKTWVEATREAAIRAGVWEGRVAPDTARDHLLRLRSAGVSIAHVARHTGLCSYTLWELTRPNRTELILADTRDLILAVPVPDRPPLPPGMVYPHGTVRRVQALCREGWPISLIEKMASVPGLYRTMRRETIRQETAQKIATLAWELAGRGGPSVRVARQAAARRNPTWPTFMDWGDQGDIDDPDAVPYSPPADAVPDVDGCGRLRYADIDNEAVRGVLTGTKRAGPPRRFTAAERDEAIRRGSIPREHGGPGLSAETLGKRLDATSRTVQRTRARMIMLVLMRDVIPTETLDALPAGVIGSALMDLTAGPPPPGPQPLTCLCGAEYGRHLNGLPGTCHAYERDPADELVAQVVERLGRWPTGLAETGAEQARHLGRLAELDGVRLPAPARRGSPGHRGGTRRRYGPPEHTTTPPVDLTGLLAELASAA